jgi:hypothetical protein
VIAADLAAIGFTASNDGVLRISAARVELVPTGRLFYEVRITGSDGDLITVIVHKSGITRERASASSVSLISDR